MHFLSVIAFAVPALRAVIAAPASGVHNLRGRDTVNYILDVIWGIQNATAYIPSECNLSCNDWVNTINGCETTFESYGSSPTTAEVTALEDCLCSSLTSQEPNDGPQCVSCFLGDPSISTATYQDFVYYFNLAGNACEQDGYITSNGVESRSTGAGVGTTSSPAAGGGNNNGLTTSSPVFTPANPQSTSTPIAATTPSSALKSGGTSTIGTPAVVTTTKTSSSIANAPSTTAKSAAGCGTVSFTGTFVVAAVLMKILM
ncbi:hypothetical protein T439DRAFT_354067 [Meredithblackwellia eburnea MCA 4105]